MTRARQLLASVPLQPELWPEFLTALAHATGSRGAQLIGVGGGHLIFNVCVGMPEALVAEWARSGGANSDSPMMRASLTAPLMTVLSAESLLDDEDLERHRALTASFAAHDVPHHSFVMLRRAGDDRLSMSLIRSTAEGPLDQAGLAVFEALIPDVAAALDVQERLSAVASSAAREAMQALGHAAYVCDAWGRVLAMTEAGARLAQTGQPVAVLDNRLIFTAPCLAESAGIAGAGGKLRLPREIASFVVDAPAGHVIDVHRLPHDIYVCGAAPASLVIVRPDEQVQTAPPRHDELTMAERAIAELLMRGASTRHIAQTRQVGFETVRGQIKAIYAKMHVKGRAEFMARAPR